MLATRLILAANRRGADSFATQSGYLQNHQLANARGSDVRSHAKMPTRKFNIDDTLVVPQLRDVGFDTNYQ